jgi:hypothetical protein
MDNNYFKYKIKYNNLKNKINLIGGSVDDSEDLNLVSKSEYDKVKQSNIELSNKLKILQQEHTNMLSLVDNIHKKLDESDMQLNNL